MEICFATNNSNKIKEVQNLVGEKYQLLSLADIGCFEELPEEQATLEGNAAQKAMYVYEKYGLNCFADDTGLEVDALNGDPGVFSARYAGPQRSNEDNILLLLKNLSKVQDRSASFRTIIHAVIDGGQSAFEGKVSGEILAEYKGDEGFGYDPIFKPAGFELSFAQMTLEEKNKISHRAKAVNSFSNFLNTNFLKGQ
ncbi:MAG: XTP/dITP diphosphohydrolase [Marivirga sp.]|jgi:XTP/dITP diphosphohydrolase